VDKKSLARAQAGPAGKSLPQSRAPGIDTERFRWSARDIDHEYGGEWDWDLTSREAKNVLDLLAQMSELTWREIKDRKNSSKYNSRPLFHSQQIDTICSEAQQRLDELEIAVDEVHRFRHGNLGRLWGYMMGPTFNILWWDRGHRICPVDNYRSLMFDGG
jgi:hypothetical protein